MIEAAVTPGRRAVAQFTRMLGADGGRLEWVDESATALRVRYLPGIDACPTCVFEPADLGTMIADWLGRNGSSIVTVEVIRA